MIIKKTGIKKILGICLGICMLVYGFSLLWNRDGKFSDINGLYLRDIRACWTRVNFPWRRNFGYVEINL